MYTNFFGFTERPFDVTPDPRFLYESPSHQETLASLIYGIRERRGFIAIVGEVGTGKTTLLKALLERIDDNTQVAFIFNTDMTFVQILNMALVDLGLASREESLAKDEALHRLNDFAIEQLTRGGNLVLIVDEAQNLDRRSMENLRLLSNLETRKHKLIQIVLSGQPELDDKLSQPQLRQLAQRINLKRYITPLSEKEVHEYIRHRLSVADCNDRHLFGLRAQQLIWQYSGGVPRKINILCDNALLIGYGLKHKRIKGPIVEEAIRDLSWSPLSSKVETPAAIHVEEKASQLEAEESHSRFVNGATEIAMGVEEKAQLLKAIASHSRFGSGVTRVAMGMEEKVRQLKARLPQPLFASRRSLAIAACVVFVLGFFLGGLLLKPENEESPNPHDVVRSKITSESRADNKVSGMSRADEAPSLSKGTDQPSSQTQSGLHAQTGMASEVALASVPEEPREIVTRSEIPSRRTVTSKSRTDKALSSSKGSDQNSASSRGRTYTPAGVASEVESANVREEKADFFHSLLAKKPKENASTYRPGDKRSWKSVIVKHGDIFSKLVASVYGRANEDNQRLVKRHNPHIGDIDNIEVGQRIIFPPPYATDNRGF
jgi:type II secretory pathway predicted ATPase ExeA